MPSINIPVTKEELEYLKKFKLPDQNWKEFLMSSLWLKGCTIRTPRNQFGKEWNIKPPVEIIKPCYGAGYCPYGQLVEAFHIAPNEYTEHSCRLFGHDCPTFYCSEPLTEAAKIQSDMEQDHPEPTA